MERSNFIKIFRGILTALLLSVFFVSSCSAKKVLGYIITKDLELLYGEVKINVYNPYLGGYTFNGINLDTFHSNVSFKSENEKHFRNYEPEDINGFGFTFKSVKYNFRSFDTEPKSIFKKGRTKDRFLLLVYKGEVYLYRDIEKIITPDNYSWDNAGVYYLYNNAFGINKVVLTKEVKSITDLLTLYSVEKDFLNDIPPKLNLNGIKYILVKYDSWLRNTKTENQIY